MNKQLYILRGVPGSGKSTVAKGIAGTTGIVAEADAYFYDEAGNYNFDGSKLPEAHKACFEKVKAAMEAEVQTIVLANTNTKTEHFADYEAIAADYGYLVHVLVIENRHGGTNRHGVPQKALNRMKDQILNSLKL